MREKLRNTVITEVCNLFTVHSPKGRHVKINNRYCYGLSFCIEGQITYRHNGREYVSKPGYAVILPEGQTYTLTGDEEGVFPVINFHCLEPLCETHAVIPLTQEQSCLGDYEEMLRCALTQNNRLRLIGLLYRILDRITSSESGTLTPALDYIEAHYDDPTLTNAQLAQQCCFSEVYFRRLFLEQFGVTPKQYVIEFRINRARQLLEGGDMKINAVSRMCGFSNSYHFSRAFKQHVGVTPTEYMLENRTPRL